jgi:aspartate/methionine/tyrosine aminotransferase
MSREEQKTVLDHCRHRGIWVIADEVYERLYYGDDRPDACAPSFLDIASRDERVICVNSFSKAYLMTGWRLGWLVAPASLMDDLAKLIEYNTSCAPSFVQQAGIAALGDGGSTARQLVRDLRAARDHLVESLRSLPGVSVTSPPGAMYLFFSLPGSAQSLALCKALVREVGLGLAPGSAFGTEGEGYVRWCYACDIARIDAGLAKLHTFLERRARLNVC